MIVGIVGLGLIGGSLAKAYKAAGDTVYVYNRTKSVSEFAKLSGDADALLTPENLGECELIHLSLYPALTVGWLRQNAEYISKSALVIDDCGTKRMVCGECFPIAEKYGFTFVGGHPMAGTHNSGYKYSRANMFNNATMIIVPPVFDDIKLLDRVKTALIPLGLGRLKVTNAEKHDQMIAYTSQLAHVVSSAYIKSPSSGLQKGYSAGSFRDLTRVAKLNEGMWTELFLENSDYLLAELDCIIKNLEQYRQAIAADDADTLCALLREGRIAKELSEKQSTPAASLAGDASDARGLQLKG